MGQHHRGGVVRELTLGFCVSDRHTYIQTDRQTDRHKYIHTYIHTDRQTAEQTDRSRYVFPCEGRGIVRGADIQYSHSDQVEIVPSLLQQIIKVPLVVSRYGDSMWNTIDDVQFLHEEEEEEEEGEEEEEERGTLITNADTSIEIWSILFRM